MNVYIKNIHFYFFLHILVNYIIIATWEAPVIGYIHIVSALYSLSKYILLSNRYRYQIHIYCRCNEIRQRGLVTSNYPISDIHPILYTVHLFSVTFLETLLFISKSNNVCYFTFWIANIINITIFTIFLI